MGYNLFDKMNRESSVEEIYAKYNATDKTFENYTLIDLFNKTVKKYPNNIAIKNGNEEISYEKLHKMAVKVADSLNAKGIRSGDKIGIIASRKISTLINIIGTLMAGAAYVPIEPEFPEERKTFIVSNSKCKALLEDNALPKIYETTSELVKTDKFEPTAYVIYTSGSTGHPKGVEISNKAVVNTILDVIEKFNITEKDKILGVSSMCFDLSVFDIFVTFATGATLVQIEDPRDVSDILALIEKESITIINSIPSTMELYVNNSKESYKNNSVRLSLLSGDWISLKLPDKIKMKFPNCKVISLGGATEASIWSIYFPIDKVNDTWNSIPYGYPLANQKIYILNYEQKLCSYGIEGEIYIGGQGVAKGYINDQIKTEKAFVEHSKLGRLYRTGDYGVMTRENYIRFLGRKDSQVKLHGYRIELGEIESVMKKFPSMTDAAVSIIKNEANSDILCAFYVMEEKFLPDLKKYMQTYLPTYMIPTEFVKIDSIPLTLNGKVDRNALKTQRISQNKLVTNTAEKNVSLETRLIQLLKNVFPTKVDISANDNFFELGLNSISMVNLVGEIEKELGIQLKFKEFLKANNIHELAEILNESTISTVEHKEVYKASDKEHLYDPFPISDVQLAYFMGRDEAFELGGTSTHAYGEIESTLNIELFNQSLQKVIDRHPVLRSIILPNGMQKILKNTEEYQIEVLDYSGMTEEQFQEKVLMEREHSSHHVFKPNEWPLFSFKAFKTPHNTNYLFVELDLLIGDGMSMRILVNEIMEFYNNPSLVLPQLNYTFRDYMLALEEFKKTDEYKSAKKYWLDKIDEFPSAPALNYVTKVKDVHTPHFERVEKIFNETELEKLRVAARAHNVTVSSVLCTAFSKVLEFWSNQSHFAINLTVFNRKKFHPDVNKLIGDFTSTMLLDVNFEGSDDFWEECARTQEVLMEALEYRDYNGVEFIREIAKHRHQENMAIMPIVFTSMIFDESNHQENYVDAIGKTKYERSQTSQVFLDFQASDDNNQLKMSWDYVKELFDATAIEDMFTCYIKLLFDVIDGKKKIKMEMPKDDKEFIEQYNSTEDYIPQGLLYESLYTNARLIPNNIAIINGTESITYEQLNKLSNKVGHYLCTQGIRRKDVVCVLVKPRIETIAIIYGVLKVGATYVPIDSSYPEGRIKYITNKCNSKLLVESYPEKKIWETLSDEDLKVSSLPTDLAYIIFTSGSTGMPKGVEITHAAAYNTIFDINNRFNISEEDKILGVSSLCFDLSIYDLFGTHMAGASLVQVEDSKDINEICSVIKKENITVYNSVPAIMELVVSNMKPTNNNLRLVLLSGDWIPTDLPDKIRKTFGKTEIISLGGATEASIWSIYYKVDKVKKEWESIPYGCPLRNQKMYILDSKKRICPVGVIGEIYIGGRGVAAGYVNESKLTAEAFISHELGYLYRTGDYGVLVRDGYIKFMGRRDSQVKIGGYRIELGEIQSKLMLIDCIKKAVVLVKEGKDGSKFLNAYVETSAEVQEKYIKENLSKYLPKYMIPDQIITVDSIPLTGNGKINTKVLLDLSKNGCSKPQVYIKPKNETEEKVYELWKQALGIEEFSVDEDFYMLGGHSITMIKLLALIEKEMNVKLSYSEFIQNPTVLQNALVINSKKTGSLTQYPELCVDQNKEYEEFELTDIQMAYLVGRNTALKSGGVSTHMYTELITELDMKKFNVALNKTILRHGMLRAIVYKTGKQIILKDVPEYSIFIEDISDLSEIEQQDKIVKKRENLSSHVFDTEKWPLFNFEAFYLGKGKSYLFVEFDQLIADGTSIQIITNDILDFYFHPNATIQNTEITFRDYMETYSLMRTQDKYDEDKRYWQEKIDIFPEAPMLPIIKEGLQEKKWTFKRLSTVISKEKYEKIKNFAMKNRTTVSVVLCAAYSKVLSDWCNQKKIALNLTLFNRYPFHRDVDKLVGDFTSVLLLDIDCSETDNYSELCSNIQRTLAEAMEHKLYEGIQVIRDLARKKGMVNQPVMPIVFTSMLFGEHKDSNHTIGKQVYTSTQTTQVFLDHQANDMDGNLNLTWDYVSDLFDKDVIEKMFEQYISNVNNIIDGNVLFEEQLNTSDINLLKKYNMTETTISDKSLIELFTESVRKYPDNIAVIDNDDMITYGGLDQMSNQMANYLKEKEIEKGDKVAILGYRDFNTIVGVLGILKLGAAYVPLDPEVPKERREFIRKNSEYKYLLDTKNENEWTKYACQYEIEKFDETSLAYIIYTSGSTGKPKGVMISNSAAVNTILNINKKFGITSNDRIAGISSLCFDLSVYDIFGAFEAGASMVVIKDQRNMQDVIKTVEKNKVTVWNSVPAIMEMGIRYIKTSGENDYAWDMEAEDYELHDKKLYWSPAAVWKISNNALFINNKVVEDSFMAKFLPELYFYVQDGRSKDEILDHFSDLPQKDLQKSIENLLEEHILIDSILSPEELFETQDKLYQHTFGETLIYDAESYKEFKKMQMRRQLDYRGERIKLLNNIKYPDVINDRESCREFNQKKKIPFSIFSAALSVFAQRNTEGKVKYNYSSAGGLYPIDLYVYIKKDRIESVNPGLYYYNPVNNGLIVVEDGEVISSDAHYFTNKSIFNSSAFSLFFVYNAAVTMPRYGGAGYEYGFIDTGIMTALFTQICQYLNLGTCSIGDMNFSKIAKKFKMKKSQMWIHTVECGIKKDNSELAMLPVNQDLKDKSDNSQLVNSDLRVVMLSGDWIPKDLPSKIKSYAPNANIVSLGGATEASIWSIYYPVDDVDKKWKSIPYGYPLANQKVYIMDTKGHVLPVGVKGEICIGGMGVAKGYCNDEEKTNQAFITYPRYGRVYRTGDFGIMHQEGYIEFLGRKDYQVKINGYRIELQEIENALTSNYDIENCVVKVQTDQFGDVLIAYYTANSEVNEVELKTSLKGILPDYMIPKYFMKIDCFYLNSNGKIDRNKLPKFNIKVNRKENGVIAKTDTERKVCNIVEDVLQVSGVQISDDFFEIGGDSLRATEFVAKVEKIFKVKIGFEIFENSKISDVVETIENKRNEVKEKHEMNNNIEMIKQGSNTHKKFFLFSEVQGAIDQYYPLAKFVKDEYCLYGVKDNWFNGLSAMNVTLEALSKIYVDEIVELTDDKDEVILGGWSFGGLWVLEVYKQLRAYRKVKYLAIIDSLQPDAVFDMPLEFTLNEEKEIVKQYISPSIEVDSAPNTEELWKMVIGYFKKNTHSYERFINGFGDLSFVLQEADPVECIKHFNLFRTLSSAQSKYKMGNESYDIPVVLVKAEKSYINMDLEVWNTLFPNNQMLMYPVNHNQIIQEPVASEWINNLNQVI